jgi:pathogenesis-related protein 1
MNPGLNRYLFTAVVAMAVSCTDQTPDAAPVSGQAESSGAPQKGRTSVLFFPRTTGASEGDSDGATNAETSADGGTSVPFRDDAGAGDGGELEVPLSLVAAGESGRVRGMLAYHNAIRASIDGGVARVLPLDWSVELASIAQAYADELAATGCKLQASINGYGENLAGYSGGTVSVKQVVADWAGEARCYSYGMYMVSDDCSPLCGGCSRYTQLVWRDTAEVGCGVAVCDGSPYREIWCCNYNPPGNILGQYP